MNPVVITTGPGRDESNRDRIDELAFCEPAVLQDHSAMEEGHDSEAAAKNE